MCENGTFVCAIIDDASRKILAIGEFENANEENSIKILENVIKEYSGISPLRELLIDHGSHFGAHRIDEKGEWNSKFKELAENNGIKVILGRVKHPQTNGKIEKWFDLYLKYRKDFENVEEFVHWYNCIRPHESLEKKERLVRPDTPFGRNCQMEGYLDCSMKGLGGDKDDEKLGGK